MPFHYLFIAILCLCGTTVFSYQHSFFNAAAPSGWRLARSPQRNARVDVVLCLRQRNEAKATAVLKEVSNPTSSRYGHYLSLEEVSALMGPLPEHVQRVQDALTAGGAVQVVPLRDASFIQASFSVAKAEDFFRVQLREFEHGDLGPHRRIVRTEASSVHLPDSIGPLVETIVGLYDFPFLRPKYRSHRHDANSIITFVNAGADSLTTLLVPQCLDGSFPSSMPLCGSSTALSSFTLTAQQTGLPEVTATVDAASHCECAQSTCRCAAALMGLVSYINTTLQVTATFANSSTLMYKYTEPIIPKPWVTADTVYKFYAIADDVVKGKRAPNNSQSVAEFVGQYFSTSDLKQYTTLMGLPYPTIITHGPNNSSQPGGEATLDVQWITTTGVGIPLTVWSQMDFSILVWAMAVASDPNPPLVHSISYGTPEVFSDAAQMQRANTELMKLGLRGLTVISTSGDLGVSDGVNCSAYFADFPSSSPYTTSLGATAVARADTRPICTSGHLYEVGARIECPSLAEVPTSLDNGDGFTTGGMFSSVFPRPSYQDAAVTKYLTTAPLSPGQKALFNSTGRAYNDVAALGSNILVVQNGKIEASGGTSASGPIFAGVVALLNDVRLKLNKPPLGFINPFLYQTAVSYPSAFNVISIGNNRCGERMCCPTGLPGNPGWDPLSGLGSPVYSELAQLVAAM